MRLRPGMVWVHCGGTAEAKTISSLLLTQRFERYYCGFDGSDPLKLMAKFNIGGKVVVSRTEIDDQDQTFPFSFHILPPTEAKKKLVIIDSIEMITSRYTMLYHHRNHLIRQAREWKSPVMMISQVSRETMQKAKKEQIRNETSGYLIGNNLGFDAALPDIITTSLRRRDNSVLIQCLKGYKWASKIWYWSGPLRKA